MKGADKANLDSPLELSYYNSLPAEDTIEYAKIRRRITRVTRFGEILPLWQIIKSLWQFLEVSFSVWNDI